MWILNVHWCRKSIQSIIYITSYFMLRDPTLHCPLLELPLYSNLIKLFKLLYKIIYFVFRWDHCASKPSSYTSAFNSMFTVHCSYDLFINMRCVQKLIGTYWTIADDDLNSYEVFRYLASSSQLKLFEVKFSDLRYVVCSISLNFSVRSFNYPSMKSSPSSYEQCLQMML